MDIKKETRGGRRTGAGRPSHFVGKKKKAINLTLTVEAIELLTSSAKSMNVSRSDIVNKLIFEFL